MSWNKPRTAKIVPENVVGVIFQRPLNIARKKKPVMSTHTDSETTGTSEMGVDQKIETLKANVAKINRKIPFAYLLNTNKGNKT